MIQNYQHTSQLKGRQTGLCRTLICLFILISTLVPLHQANANTSGTELIVSASEVDYPPFSMVDKNNLADGFSVELLRATLQAMGKEVSFKVGPWSEVKQSLIDKKVQVLPLVGRTPEREAFFDFTFPYISMHGTIIVRADNTEIKSLADLSGKQVAIMAGDNAEEFLVREKMDLNIEAVESFDIALQNLSDGQYDAVIVQKLLATQIIAKHRIPNLKTVGPPLEDFVQSFCFAVQKGDAELLSTLNEGLSLVIADGTLEHLRKKWFGSLTSPSKSRIIIGGDYNYPPYEYLDENDQPAGYNVDLSRAIAKNLGLTVDIQLGPWAETRKKLERNEIDLIQGMFYSAERDKTFDFTGAHTYVTNVIVSRDDVASAENIEDLAGKIIVVMDGDITHDTIVKAGYSKQLILAQTQQEALRLLSEGDVDYALLAKVPANYWIEKEGITNLRVGNKALISSEYCYASHHANQGLIELFAQGLSDLKAGGEYRAIHQKWLGVYEQQGINQQTIIRYTLLVTIPLILIAIVAFFWTQTLKKQVKARTDELIKEVSERKQVEKQLHNSQKFEAIGQLAGGVAHDFNNLLTIVFGYSELILRRYKDDERIQKDVTIIVDAAKRGENLTRQLLAFSRKQVLAPKTVDLNTHLSDFKSLLSRLIKENIQLDLCLAEEHSLVMVDPTQIEQILVNLVVNARDAIGENNGNIRIDVKRSKLDPLNLEEFPHEADNYFGLITVEDTGCGIPEEIRQKVFDPFFTTKEQGRGTGLGLSTVMGIVKQSNGYLFMESQPGIGSKFYIYLPQSCNEVHKPSQRINIDSKLLSQKTILVVDDESALLAIIAQTLETAGCKVITVNSAEDVFKIWPECSDTVDMILTDIDMPKMTGLDLAKILLEKNSALQFLFISGYGDFHTQKVDQVLSQRPFLHKPFTPEELLTKVSNVLSDGGGTK